MSLLIHSNSPRKRNILSVFERITMMNRYFISLETRCAVVIGGIRRVLQEGVSEDARLKRRFRQLNTFAHDAMKTYRSFWSLLKQVLHLQESPQRTALAFAVGTFIAFCPVYPHTVMALICAWLFRLNFLALFAAASINNPWTMVPILGVTYWTGALLTGRNDVPSLNWSDLSFTAIYQQILSYAVPFALGGFVLSVIGALLTYPAAYFLVSKYRRRVQRQTDASPDRGPCGRSRSQSTNGFEMQLDGTVPEADAKKSAHRGSFSQSPCLRAIKPAASSLLQMIDLLVIP